MENEFNTTLNKLRDNEKIEYILDCIPMIREYTDTREDGDAITVSKFNVKRTTLSKKGDVYKKFKKKEQYTDAFEVECSGCKSSNVFYCSTSGDDVCTDCGFAVSSHMFDVDYKEERDMDKTIVYSYKRENHFNEWINQFQAKEMTTVPQTIIQDLHTELKKQKIIILFTNCTI